MNNSLVTALGLAAAIIGTVTYFPQLYKVIKTRQTRDISLSTYLLLTTVTLMWLVYGILIKDLPLIINGSLVLSCVSLITLLKIKNG
jgi:MtN3 and saliva related transmembrane protein